MVTWKNVIEVLANDAGCDEDEDEMIDVEAYMIPKMPMDEEKRILYQGDQVS